MSTGIKISPQTPPTPSLRWGKVPVSPWLVRGCDVSLCLSLHVSSLFLLLSSHGMSISDLLAFSSASDNTGMKSALFVSCKWGWWKVNVLRATPTGFHLLHQKVKFYSYGSRFVYFPVVLDAVFTLSVIISCGWRKVMPEETRRIKP